MMLVFTDPRLRHLKYMEPFAVVRKREAASIRKLRADPLTERLHEGWRVWKGRLPLRFEPEEMRLAQRMIRTLVSQGYDPKWTHPVYHFEPGAWVA